MNWLWKILSTLDSSDGGIHLSVYETKFFNFTKLKCKVCWQCYKHKKLRKYVIKFVFQHFRWIDLQKLAMCEMYLKLIIQFEFLDSHTGNWTNGTYSVNLDYFGNSAWPSFDSTYQYCDVQNRLFQQVSNERYGCWHSLSFRSDWKCENGTRINYQGKSYINWLPFWNLSAP